LFLIFGLVFEKSKKILLCLLFPSALVSNSKTQKYLLFYSGFVKLLQSSVSRDSIGAWLSLYITQATQVKGNNDDI
jgi:hypothetical protein